MTDANQDLEEKTKILSMRKIKKKYNLQDIFINHHGETWLPSTKRSLKKIDHIVTKNIDPQIFRRSR